MVSSLAMNVGESQSIFFKPFGLGPMLAEQRPEHSGALCVCSCAPEQFGTVALDVNGVLVLLIDVRWMCDPTTMMIV